MNEFQRFEHDRWQKTAKAYATTFSPLTSQAIKPLLDAARVVAGTRLLDVACGTGDLSELAAQRQAQPVAIDFSSEVVALAKERYPHLDIDLGDVEALTFDDGSFDAVVMAFLLGHLAEPQKALAEAHRVLTPGGRLAVSWWSALDRVVAFSAIMNGLNRFGTTDLDIPPALPFFHFSDPATLSAAFTEAGFTDVEVFEQTLSWPVTSGAVLVDTFLQATARTGALLAGQTSDVLARIKESVSAALAPYASERGGLLLPMPVLVAGGTKAA